MPKNKGKGGKNRRRGKNENESEKRELIFKEDGQGTVGHYFDPIQISPSFVATYICLDNIPYFVYTCLVRPYKTVLFLRVGYSCCVYVSGILTSS
jgi:hypothetical protein